MKLLEERKKKLAAEGLFDEARKQLLPFLPRVIGVVTSPTGAVIRDILHRLADRFPRRVLVWPVRVQGEASAAEVANAIRGFNALPERGPLPRPDLIIVARGGGSLEDLWSFNEEIVVRAAAESMIPLISAVGHETDITLIDFVSDRRAPTPTAAAEMAVPVRAELLAEIAASASRKIGCWQRGLERRRNELRAAARALPALDELLADPRQRLDAVMKRLPRALHANAQLHRTHLTRVAARLSPRLLKQRMARSSEIVVALGQRGQRARDQLHAAPFRPPALAPGNCSTAFSYRGVLARGFALVRDGAGRPLRSAAAVAAGARLDIEFSDGRVGAVADGERAAQARRQAKVAPRGGRRAPAARQPVRGLSPIPWARRLGFRTRRRRTILGRRSEPEMEATLLNRYDRSPPMNGEAEVRYLDGDFRVVRPGAFVRCAVTGVPIPLEELKYWSVDRQEAYATPEAVIERQREQRVRLTRLRRTARFNAVISAISSVTGSTCARSASAASAGSPAMRA